MLFGLVFNYTLIKLEKKSHRKSARLFLTLSSSSFISPFPFCFLFSSSPSCALFPSYFLTPLTLSFLCFLLPSSYLSPNAKSSNGGRWLSNRSQVDLTSPQGNSLNSVRIFRTMLLEKNISGTALVWWPTLSHSAVAHDKISSKYKPSTICCRRSGQGRDGGSARWNKS